MDENSFFFHLWNLNDRIEQRNRDRKKNGGPTESQIQHSIRKIHTKSEVFWCIETILNSCTYYNQHSDVSCFFFSRLLFQALRSISMDILNARFDYAHNALALAVVVVIFFCLTAHTAFGITF